MFALILAGGKGERMRPLTDGIPKPMVPLCGKPILEHQIGWLRSGGVTDVVFLSGYRWQAIQDHFGNGQSFNVRAHYSVEETPLGRGGAVKKGLGVVPDDAGPVVVLNGDTLTDEPLNTLIDRHAERRATITNHLATLMVVPFVSPHTIVELDAKLDVVGFRESAQLPHWINAGVYIFEMQIFDELPDLGDHEVLTFPTLAKRKQLLAVQSNNFWIGIDSFEDLEVAERYVNR